MHERMEHSNRSNEQQHSSNVLPFHFPPGHNRGDVLPQPAAHGGGGVQLEFRNVSLQDTASGEWLLNGISFHVRPGTRVGIVGPIGSGKMSLLNLLTRFHRPSRGDILLNGKDTREYELAYLRQQFSIVPREPALCNASMAANIACADPQASRAAVMRAATLADAHRFIESLPLGYDTMLEEGGSELSPGERHLVAIARAFLKQAPMLVLDEPAGTEGPRFEQLISDAMDRLMAGRISFTIAHRISTLERCDMVLVLKNGTLEAVCTGDDYAKTPRLRRPPGSAPSSTDRLTCGPVLMRLE
jgi:ABC-type multidrug transport system fused ATPase/permease subunit